MPLSLGRSRSKVSLAFGYEVLTPYQPPYMNYSLQCAQLIYSTPGSFEQPENNNNGIRENIHSSLQGI